MQWSEVRLLYPNQVVYLEDLCSQVEGGHLHVDTGSAHTWINVNAVEGELALTPDGADEIVTAFGIGGRDRLCARRLMRLRLIAFMLTHCQSMPGVLVSNSVG